jgi:dolichol-phosphate mannosyltransferase
MINDLYNGRRNPHETYNQSQILSIIIPTYNESRNILRLIENIKDNLPNPIFTEIIIVDDNSPDGTGKIVEGYLQDTQNSTETSGQMYYTQTHIKIIHRARKNGLVSAILDGIKSSAGNYILIMDADFSHPPQLLSQMVDELFLDSKCDIVIASRYVKGGSLKGWPLKRRLISKGAIKVAKYVLGIHVKDPTSGFFAFRRDVIDNIKIDTKGYKLLLEMLVKAKDAKVTEIPYSFTNRSAGKSKLDNGIILDYMKAVLHLYRHSQKTNQASLRNSEREEKSHNSLLFFSKAAKFSTVGASGLIVNYLVSFLLSNGVLSSLWYVKATLIGIIVSMTSNFFLNKVWTFEDKNFSARHTIKQYGMFVTTCSVGAVLQLVLVFQLVQSGTQYEFSLILAVVIASLSNFFLNKKWTFHEKIWG